MDEHQDHDQDKNDKDSADSDSEIWAVGRDEVASVVAAYREAVRQAEELAAALDRAGLGGEVVALTAELDDRGEPLVRGVLTLAGARRLAALLDAGPPPPGLPVRHGPPPWAA